MCAHQTGESSVFVGILHNLEASIAVQQLNSRKRIDQRCLTMLLITIAVIMMSLCCSLFSPLSYRRAATGCVQQAGGAGR